MLSNRWRALFISILLILSLTGCTSWNLYKRPIYKKHHRFILDRNITLNQVGYVSHYKKIASIVVPSGEKIENQFSVIDKNTRRKVWPSWGNEKLIKYGIDESSNMLICKADFTKLQKAGEYYIRIGNRISLPFKITKTMDELYPNLEQQIVSTFYLHRQNTPIKARFLTTLGLQNPLLWEQKAQHQGDSALTAFENWTDCLFDVAGGHDDAGGDGKYLENMAVSYWKMLHLYEFNTLYLEENFDTLKFNIPERDNSIPDLLDEIEWGVHPIMGISPKDMTKHCGHKIHSMIRDGGEGSRRYVLQGTTTASFATARLAAHISRLIRQYNKGGADRYWVLAQSAYKRGKHLPTRIYPNRDDEQMRRGGYKDMDIFDDSYAAAVEMYLTARIRKDRNTEVYKMDIMTNDYHGTYPAPPDWGEYEGGDVGCGVMSLLATPHSLNLDNIKNALVDYAYQRLSKIDKHGFPSVLSNGEYLWGSFGAMLGEIQTFVHAFRITGDRQFIYGAHEILNYLLGCNPMRISMIPKWGTFYETELHDERQLTVAPTDPPASLMPGGPLKRGFSPPAYYGDFVCKDRTPREPYDGLNYYMADGQGAGMAWCSKENTIDIQGALLFAIITLKNVDRSFQKNSIE